MYIAWLGMESLSQQIPWWDSYSSCVLLSCKSRIKDFYILGFSKALNSQVSIKLLAIFKHQNIFQYQLQSSWSWYSLHTIPLIIRAEHFAVVNGFYSCETGKFSHSFDSLKMAHVIDLEAFPEPHREAGMKPRTELMSSSSIHSSVWSPLFIPGKCQRRRSWSKHIFFSFLLLWFLP